jgi:hypothetical protein
VHWGWYLFLIAGISLAYAAGAVLAGRPASLKFPDGGWTATLGALAFAAILGPVEEFGWRGVAQPLLQRRLAPVWAGLVLGVTWGLWHLPAFFLAGTPQSNWTFLPFFGGAVAISLIITPLFNRSGGSLLLPMLAHFQLNGPLWPDGQPWDTAVFAVVALAVVWIYRDEMFRRGAGATEVVPAPH